MRRTRLGVVVHPALEYVRSYMFSAVVELHLTWQYSQWPVEEEEEKKTVLMK